MTPGHILGNRFYLRWANRNAPIGLFRWWTAETIGLGGFRPELPGFRCESCRIILANY